MSKKKAKCFIIMPITTPRNLIEIYGDDPDHFEHVLEDLFVPAVEQAGYDPVRPKSKGSDLIQAEIIEKIETSEFLLCDMSILNPNVFFELGIRTALNKPVALVRDDRTDNVPFDINMINHHTYRSQLVTWVVKEEIPKLAEHLAASFSGKRAEENSLWSYFSLSAVAQPPGPPKTGDEIVYIMRQLDSLRALVERQQLSDLEQAVQTWSQRQKHDRFGHIYRESVLEQIFGLLSPNYGLYEQLAIEEWPLESLNEMLAFLSERRRTALDISLKAKGLGHPIAPLRSAETAQGS